MAWRRRRDKRHRLGLKTASQRRRELQEEKRLEEERRGPSIVLGGAAREAAASAALGHSAGSVQDALALLMGTSPAESSPSTSASSSFPPASTAAARPEPASVVLPQLEAARLRAVQGLLARFEALCKGYLGGKRWHTHFESWLWEHRDAEGGGRDPILPGEGSERSPELAAKLMKGGAKQHVATDICIKLGRAAAMARRQVGLVAAQSGRRGGRRSKVGLERFTTEGLGRAGGRAKVKLVCNGVATEINPGHLERLRASFTRARAARRAGGKEGRGAATEQPKGSDATFAQAVFCCLARYFALQGGHPRNGGFQAAMHAGCFNVLATEFGVTQECFASPLNAHAGFDAFCSAFPDTDAAFGSVGSFFAFRPTAGSYQANPPFHPVVVERMLAHMEALLVEAKAAGKALAFTVIIPHWPDQACWRGLSTSHHCAHQIRLDAVEHGYFEGAQHTKLNQYRVSNADSSVFWLQTPEATRRWPVTDAKIATLRAAFRPRHALAGNKSSQVDEPETATAGQEVEVAADEGGAGVRGGVQEAQQQQQQEEEVVVVVPVQEQQDDGAATEEEDEDEEEKKKREKKRKRNLKRRQKKKKRKRAGANNNSDEQQQQQQ